MNESLPNRPTLAFTVIGILALVWNLLGLLAFVAQVLMSETAIAEMPAEQQELYRQMPQWVTIAFGVAVVCGVLGCIALLVRKKLAVPVFVISLLGVLAQHGYLLLLSDTINVMGGWSDGVSDDRDCDRRCVGCVCDNGK